MGEGDWRWTAGLFVKDSDDFRRNRQSYLLRLPLTQETAPVTFAAFDSLLKEPANHHQDTLDEMSVYGELAYDFSERLELTLGARVTDMEQSIDNSRAKTKRHRGLGQLIAFPFARTLAPFFPAPGRPP